MTGGCIPVRSRPRQVGLAGLPYRQLVKRGSRIMANTPKWNIRLRHEWLSTPLKKKRIKRGQKVRIGMLDAEIRKAAKKAAKPEPQAT